MQPKNPLFTPKDQLDHMVSKTLRDSERLNTERDILNKLDKLFDSEHSFQGSGREAEGTKFSNIGELVGSFTFPDTNGKLYVNSDNIPGVEARPFFKPSLKYIPPHDSAPTDVPDVEAVTSVVQLVYTANTLLTTFQNHNPVCIYGVRIGTRMQYGDMPNINMPDVSFDSDQLRAVVIVGQKGEVYTAVRNDTETDRVIFTTATPPQRELIFDELTQAIDNPAFNTDSTDPDM